MYKLKTSSSIAKRFKITSTGKFLRYKANHNHLLQKKSSKRKQKLRHVTLLNSRNFFNLKSQLPYIY